MTATLLDFSQSADLRPIGEIVAPITTIADRLGFDCFIIGALARDLWIVHHLGVDTGLKTEDADFAVAVPDWGSFELLRKGLLDTGAYREMPKAPVHRLRHRNGIKIDLVPFGGIERQGSRTIAFPPDNDFVMSVFGFQEVAAQTIEVRFPETVTSRVVTLPALAVLKLEAWADRHIREPRKDARDLRLIIETYPDANRDNERLYNENPYLIGSPSDLGLAGAWLLGKDMAQLLDLKGRERLARLISEEADREGQLRLASEMMRVSEERALDLLEALEHGFVGEGSEQ